VSSVVIWLTIIQEPLSPLRIEIWCVTVHSKLIHDPVWTDALISVFSLYSVSKLDTFENEINYAYETMNTVFVSACRQNKFRNILASEEFGVGTDTTIRTFFIFRRLNKIFKTGAELIEYLNK
jgi:hypothetical protein